MRGSRFVGVLTALVATGCTSGAIDSRQAWVVPAVEGPFNVLKGQWDGSYEWDPYFSGLGKEDVTLVIESVTGSGPKREVVARWTQMRRGTLLSENALAAGTAELAGDTIVVRLSTNWNLRLRLVLRGELLDGDSLPGYGASSHSPNKVLLQRKYPDSLARESRRSIVAALPPEARITDAGSIAGGWVGLERGADGLQVELLYVYFSGSMGLFDLKRSGSGKFFYPLESRIEDGRVVWKISSRSGTLTLHEGGGTRVLRMMTNGATMVDYVFDENYRTVPARQ